MLLGSLQNGRKKEWRIVMHKEDKNIIHRGFGGVQVVYDSCRETIAEAELCGETGAGFTQGLRGFPKSL